MHLFRAVRRLLVFQGSLLLTAACLAGNSPGSEEKFSLTGDYRADGIFCHIEKATPRLKKQLLLYEKQLEQPWDSAALAQSRNRHLQIPDESATQNSPGNFVFSQGSHNASINAVVENIRVVEERNRISSLLEDIPGYSSPREIPWDFVKDEGAMWLVWFTGVDSSDSDNAAVSNYISSQNTPPMLLYRLLVRPWLPAGNDRN